MPKIADIEFTPNPNAKRFVLKEPLTRGVAKSFETAYEATQDPLASALFAVPNVTNVYYVDRYLTVTQDGGADWSVLERQLAQPIREAPAAAEADTSAARPAVALNLSEEDQARLENINAILDERVRPALMMDGGGLEIMGLEGHQLKIHYMGACGTCPSSLSGTLMGIEGLLRSTVDPEIEVVAV